MTQDTSPMRERPLSPMEQGVWKMDQAAPLNFTTVARVRGPLDPAALIDALARVRRRHPHLRARIAPDDAGWPWLRSCEAAIPLRVLDASADWRREVEREVNAPIPAERGPLARCALVAEGPDDARLLLTLHHSVGDGMSGVFLVRDLLTALAGGGDDALAPLADTRPSEDRLPAKARGLRGVWARLRYLARELALTLRWGAPLRLRRDRDARCYERRARLHHVVLDADLSARLASRARAEGTTVHGALSAATLLGLLADSGRARARVVFGSPVNLRAELDPPVGEDVGFYVSMVGYGAGLRADTDLWELARDVRRRLEADLEGGLSASILALLVLAFRLLGGGRLSPRALAERWERRVLTTSGLTNLGRVSVPTRYGALALDELHFAVCPSGLGDFATTATSLGGKLYWNFMWPDPVLDEDHARALVADITRRLREAAEP